MITKNRQSADTIREIVGNAFPDDGVKEIKELTEGMCNAAYMVTLSSGKRVVLKIASASRRGLLSNEADLMETEVAAMALAKNCKGVHVPKVLYYDFSKTKCSGKYFIMEALEGANYFSVKDRYSDQDNQKINFEIGKIERSICQIRGEKFGSLVNRERQFDHLYDYFKLLISNILMDAAAKQVVIGVPKEQILEGLERDKAVFEGVTEPVLVHWDMWEGNIFVEDASVVGIIDWERALWGEALMDDRFRSHTRNGDFLKGFGQETFTDKEWRRIYWYDVYLYLTMMVEGAYREYETDWQYQWVKPMFDKAWELLNA